MAVPGLTARAGSVERDDGPAPEIAATVTRDLVDVVVELHLDQQTSCTPVLAPAHGVPKIVNA
jgi:hypothetical protein